MISFFKKHKKERPDFWKAYELTFDHGLPQDLAQIRFVVLDTETTGFDYTTDRILSIGALSLQNGVIKVEDSIELYLVQNHYDQRTAEIHGILKNEQKPHMSETEALERFLDYLGHSPIIAHHVNFDIGMIDRALHRNGMPKLKNVLLDTSDLYKMSLIKTNLMVKKDSYSLDELADKFDISKKDRHTALGDAYITAIAFLKILPSLRKKFGKLELKMLVKKQ